MEKNISSSIQDASPSTSAAASKNQANTSLPHIVALPSNPQAITNMRVLQLAPLKGLPEGNLNIIKLDATSVASLMNMGVLQNTGNPAAIENLQPIQNLPPFQIKIPVNQPAPTHTPILTINSTQTVPVISTQSSADITPPSVAKNVPIKISPPKKYQPNILHRKTVSNKSSEGSTSQGADKVNDGSKAHSSTSTKVKEILQKVRKQVRLNKLENKEIKKRKKKKREQSVKKEKTETTVSTEMLYIADGFRADVETLMEKCSHVYKLNFEKFCDIFKEMRFSRIFHGRQSGAELAEFTEEAIYIAKSYMIAKSVSFEENIAGLFLVYALLNLQPFPGFAPLRLVADDVASVLALERGARRQRRHDVLYVLGSVLVRGPTHAHAALRETGMELPIKKYYDGTVQVSEAVESVFTRNADCVRQLRQLLQLEQRYHSLRERLHDVKVRKLCSQPAAPLLRAYHEHIPGALHTEPAPPEEPDSPKRESETRIDLLKSIRERAMTNTVDSMRHLTGVQERLQEELSSSDEQAPAKGRGSYERKRFRAATIQTLFTAAEPKEQTHAPTPSNKEMPSLDGFGEPGPSVSNNDNNDDSNNNDSSILRYLLTRDKHTGETKQIGSNENDNTNIGEPENGMSNMTREEEISYLRSVIEEIEGSIEQDPTQLATNKPNTRQVIEIETVECDFVATRKTAKRKMDSDAEQTVEKKPKTDESKKEKDDNKSHDTEKEIEEVELISNEPSLSGCSVNKTPKAAKKSVISPTNKSVKNASKSPKNITKSVTMPKPTESPKSRNTRFKSPRKVTRSTSNTPSPNSIATKSSPKRHQTRNVDKSPKKIATKSVRSPKNEKTKSPSPSRRKKPK